MSDELRRALDDLVQDVAAEQDSRARSGGGLPVGAMTARARRNRIRHTALVSAVTACAVLGVAAGGVAVASWDRPESAPAAPPTRTSAPSPTPTSSPSPTTSSVVLPSGDPALPFGTCGSLVGAPTAAPAGEGLALELAATPSVLGGAPVDVRTTLAATSGDVGAVAPQTGPTVLFSRDGVVVATALTYPAGTTVDAVAFVYDDPDHPSRSTFVSHVTPTVCDAPGASVGEPLPAGDYAVIAVAGTWTTGRDALRGVAGDGVWTAADIASSVPLEERSVMSAAVPVRVEVQDADPATLPQAPTGPPSLDGVGVADDLNPYPDSCDTVVTPDPAGGLLAVTGPRGTVTAGTEVEVATTYGGSGRISLGRGSLLRLVRDGAVVAATAVGYDLEDVDFGSTVTTAVPTASWGTCAGGTTTAYGVALEPGTYTAYPVVLASPYGLVGPDGTEIVPRGSEVTTRQLVGEPFTLVVP
ncbi:hypothetical protein [Cellulomonas sp. GbtcB1]|uniref:hypothetical protein n=1 Tax=Cellulomonas sp. GbtcB1 TaxID=2824746 RepID=UPI001C3060AB|nr:hypothetical protein [Cellulomonas sp. GbtcB1]